MKDNKYSLRALALMLAYPDAALRAQLPQLVEAIEVEAAVPAARRLEIKAMAAELARMDAEITAELDGAVAFAEAGTLEPLADLERFVTMDHVPQEAAR